MQTGSSPHTRGTQRPPWGARRPCRDHPRIRGEHAPPQGLHGRLGGIIPAYAGNTRGTTLALAQSAGSSPHTRGTPTRQAGCACRRRDHPRIRGEHVLAASSAVAPARIIPAYAGNTFLIPSINVPQSGSSPHTRGTLSGFRQAELHDGIIPAYAGNTSPDAIDNALAAGSSPHTRGTPRAASRRCSAARDHPRIRGEHHDLLPELGARAGIIPAYAGNTSKS